MCLHFVRDDSNVLISNNRSWRKYIHPLAFWITSIDNMSDGFVSWKMILGDSVCSRGRRDATSAGKPSASSVKRRNDHYVSAVLAGAFEV